MIQANELRIGNWVQTFKLYAVVNGIISNEIINITVDGYDNIGKDIDISTTNPIKLTEDVILSCGFEGIGMYDNVYHLENFRFYLNKKSKTGLLKFEYGNDQLEIEITSVHQLQNIYFLLAGEELEISLQNP